MKIILTQETTGLGVAGDVVVVKDGYARNYLIPRGFAMRWSRGAEAEVASIRKARENRAIRDLDAAGDLRLKLQNSPVVVRARAGKEGRLFGAVTASDIVAALEARGITGVDKRRIALDAPIRNVGSHVARVQLHPEVAAKLQVEVQAV